MNLVDIHSLDPAAIASGIAVVALVLAWIFRPRGGSNEPDVIVFTNKTIYVRHNGRSYVFKDDV